MTDKPAYSLTDHTKHFLLLGAVGFCGPVVLVGYMHRDLPCTSNTSFNQFS